MQYHTCFRVIGGPVENGIPYWLVDGRLEGSPSSVFGVCSLGCTYHWSPSLHGGTVCIPACPSSSLVCHLSNNG